MLGRTHLLAGAVAGFLLGHHEALSVSIAAAAALLPDIDHPNSTIAHRIPGSGIVSLFVQHRGATHSLLALAAASAAEHTVLPLALWIPAAAGYASHLLLDLITPEGIPLLWPISRARTAVPLVRTGGLIEHAIVLPGLLAVVFLSIGWFHRLL